MLFRSGRDLRLAVLPLLHPRQGPARSQGVAYVEYAIDGDEDARDAMAQRAAGRRSLPQIFIDDRHVGGCDDLHALERTGQLDALLAA